MDDDDDRFLYGDSNETEEVSKPAVATSVPQPIPLEQVEAFAASNGVVAHLEAAVAGEANGAAGGGNATPEGDQEEGNGGEGEGEGEGEEEEEEEEEEDSEDDVEIIMEPPTRSLDFRQRPPTGRQSQSFSTPTRPTQAPAPSLTTEYTPRQREGTARPPGQTTPGPSQPTPTTPGPGPAAGPAPSAAPEQKPSDGVDPSTLPVATAPPSHPQVDPEAVGTFDGRSILEVDLNALADKGWRRPGSDISDWFNYGFDEISWEAYCHRRRDMGDLASVLKANVINFAGMPEDQLNNLPPEVRTMVIAGASAMMAQGSGNPNAGGMMPGGMNMNGGMMNPMMNPMMNMGPMMEMGGVDMGMGGQGMGMGMGPGMGDQGMGGQGMGGGMGGQGMGPQGMGGQGMGPQGMGPQGMGGQGMGGPGMGGPNMNGGALSGGVAMSSGGQGPMQGRATPDVQQMGMEGFAGTPPVQGQMPMGGEFGMQPDMAQSMGQQMYPGVEGNAGSPVAPAPPMRGGTPGHFRGRGMPPTAPLRGARGGGFAGRGRPPVRPASPLPPNVPTGPRNKNKYKDIDGSAPAVDGLDYGGGKDRTTPPEYDDRGSRKRRSSPGLEDSRGSKRR